MDGDVDGADDNDDTDANNDTDADEEMDGADDVHCDDGDDGRWTRLTPTTFQHTERFERVRVCLRRWVGRVE